MQSAPRLQVGSWINFALYTLGGALLGSRLSFVLIHQAYYSAHRLETLAFWRGGLSWPGAMVGGVLMLILIAWRKRVPFFWLADGMAQLLAPLSITAWLGCWAAGIANGPLGLGIPTLDETGLYQLHFPLQLAAAVFLMVFFIWLDQVGKTFSNRGLYCGLANLGLAVPFLLVSFFRVDSAPNWGGLRPDSWAAMVFMGVSVLFTLIVLLKPRLAKFKLKRLFSRKWMVHENSSSTGTN